jgi:hypothetical protein
VHAGSSLGASPHPEPKPGMGASSQRLRCTRPRPAQPLRSLPFEGPDRSRARSPGYFRGSVLLLTPPKRCGSRAVLPKAASHLRSTSEDVVRGCKTRSVGYGRLLPWGSVPFGVSSPGDRCVPVCLTDTVRSQGFSPSQRLDPARAAWLCFTPLPPLGFGDGLQSFSHSASRCASRRPLLSCRFS